jgi:hypothetical protein
MDLKEHDFGPQKASIRKHLISEGGDLGKIHLYRIQPIYGFLLHNVGRSWDKIYSELRQQIDSRSHLSHHIDRILSITIEFPSLQDGQLCDSSGYPLRNWRRRSLLYVDPTTRILKKLPQNPVRPPHETPKVYSLDDRNYYQFQGIWYRVSMKDFNPRDKNFDVFLNKEIFYTTPLLQFYGRSSQQKIQFCAKKEQANHREIKRLKKKYPSL